MTFLSVTSVSSLSCQWLKSHNDSVFLAQQGSDNSFGFLSPDLNHFTNQLLGVATCSMLGCLLNYCISGLTWSWAGGSSWRQTTITGRSRCSWMIAELLPWSVWTRPHRKWVLMTPAFSTTASVMSSDVAKGNDFQVWHIWFLFYQNVTLF